MEFIPVFGLVLLGYWGFYLLDIFPVALDQIAFSTALPSRMLLKPTYGELFLAFSLVALFIEMLKATQTSDTSIMERVAATVIFVMYFVIWLTQPWAGNGYFMLLTLMALLNVVGGFVITYASAKPKFNIQN